MPLSVATMIAMAAPAHADNTDGGNDQEFLGALKQAGLTFQDPDRAVAAGKKVCEMVGGGMPGVDIVKTLERDNPGFAGNGAAKFTAIAAEAYCPSEIAQVGQDTALGR